MAVQTFTPLLVVPTRNRAELALAAARSIIAEPDPRMQLWVSDNSTDAGESERLQAGIRALADSRVRYLRPPEPLAMPKHYDWIAQQVIDSGSISHLCCPSDRLVFVPGGLGRVFRIAEQHPERVVVFAQDHINDLESPVLLNQNDWTGRLVEIRSEVFIAHMRTTGFDPNLPRMLNCLSPCSVVRRVRSRYGNVLDSVSPDFCFGYRTLEQEDAFLHYDRRVVIDYALTRSNGHSHARGKLTRDYQDFLANLDARGLNYAAPIPGFPGVTNAHINEYSLVREASASPKFGAINLAVYLKLLEGDVRQVEDPEMRQTLREWLHKGEEKLAAEHSLGRDRWASRLSKVGEKATPSYLLRKVSKNLSRSRTDYADGVWRTLRRLGVSPFAVREHLSRWPTSEAALEHACRHPLAPVEARAPLEYRIRSRLLDVVH